MTYRWAARRKDTRRTGTGDGNRAAGAFAAAHRQHNGPPPENLVALRFTDGVELAFGREVEHHRIEPHLHRSVGEHFDEPVRVFGPGEFLLEAVEPETIVDALVEDAAELLVALEDEDAAQPRLIGGAGGGEPRGAASDDNQIIHGGALLSFLPSG